MSACREIAVSVVFVITISVDLGMSVVRSLLYLPSYELKAVKYFSRQVFSEKKIKEK